MNCFTASGKQKKTGIDWNGIDKTIEPQIVLRYFLNIIIYLFQVFGNAWNECLATS